nr:putative universal stress protein [uncultured bacterium]
MKAGNDIGGADRSDHSNAQVDDMLVDDAISQAIIWTSDLDFWIDESASFQEVLNEYLWKVKGSSSTAEVEQLRQSVISNKNGDLVRSKNEVFLHLRALRSIGSKSDPISNKLLLDHKDLDLKMARAEELMTGFKDRFLKLKRDLGPVETVQPQQFDNLLIPTDFSENAKRATDYALTLFGAGVNSITLLHVVPSSLIATGQYISQAGNNGVKGSGFKAEKDRIRAGFPELMEKIRVHTEVGELAERMQQVIEKECIDLVVMGTHGDLASDPPLFGTVTSKVLEQVAAPVLVVPKETPFLPPRRIVFTTDVRLNEPPAGIGMIRSFGQKYAAQLIAILVEPHDDDAATSKDNDGLRRTLEEIGLSSDDVEIVAADDALDAINQCMIDRSVDLLTMVTHHGDLFCSLYSRSDDDREMVLHSHIPVLVLNSDQR